MAAYGGFDDPGPAAEPEGGGRTALHTDAGLDELRSALLAALEQRGTLEEMRARVRAEIFATIDPRAGVGSGGAMEESGGRAPAPPHETVVANELVREFLRFHGCEHTLSVFRAECGEAAGARVGDDSATPTLGRELLCRELGVLDSAGPSGSSKLPLLYSLVSGYRDLRRQHSDAHARALG